MSEKQLKNVDGGWGWVVVFAGFIVYLIAFGLLRCQSVLFIHIVNQFESNYSEVAWVSSIATASFSFAGLATAPLIHKIGHRLTVMLGGFIASIGYILASFSPNLTFLIFSAGVVTGIGMAVAFVACPVIIGHYFNKRRSLAINIASIGASVGTLSICPMNEFLTETYGLNGYFLVCSGVILNICVAGMLMRPPPIINSGQSANEVEMEERTPDEESSLVSQPQENCDGRQHEVEKTEENGCLTTVKELITNRSYIIYCISQIVFLSGFLCNQLYIVPFAVAEIGVPKIQASFLLSIGGFLEIISRIMFGVLGDLKSVDRIWLFTGVLFAMAICAAIAPFMTTFGSLAAVIAITGLFQGGFSGTSVVILADIIGLRLYAAGLGTSTMLNGIGTLVTPPIAGYFVDTTGKQSTALYISAGILFVGAILSGMIKVSLNCEKGHPGKIKRPSRSD